MRNQFVRTLTSPEALAEQFRSYGKSRAPSAGPVRELLGPDEKNFIEVRDSFYLATIGHDGWPYIQHRGGPAGFLRVLDGTHLAFGDYNGNRQLLSAGNIVASQRVALFLMDYPARERLKILGHAEVLAPAEAGELLGRLTVPPGAVVERVIRITVLGFDWNCPKYITPRYTAEEVQTVTAPLQARIAELEAELRQRSV
jgi:predicted pyridoxine 5'-phosphate oxidase superfamily flavin-nucleotide-binding protein